LTNFYFFLSFFCSSVLFGLLRLLSTIYDCRKEAKKTEEAQSEQKQIL
jgi:hypothetical protein